jgi:signal transduction histidine kinase
MILVNIRISPEQAPRRPLLGLDQLSSQSRKRRGSAYVRADGNTANFINPAEKVSISPERLLAPPGKDMYVVFEVRDTGQGIPEEIQCRIFEPFVSQCYHQKVIAKCYVNDQHYRFSGPPQLVID